MNMFRFPTPLSIVLVAVGSLAALGGAVFALKIFLEPGGSWLKIGAAGAVTVAGLLVIACGEIVGVAYAVEEGIRSIDEHTQQTNEMLHRYLSDEKAPETLVRSRIGRM